MGKICFIMGKSSSGKDTIFKRLQEQLPQFRTITLYTTRPIREGEKQGSEYHFVDEERLKQLELSGRVIELREYNTKCGIWKYFTVDDGQIELDRHDYLTIGTLQSYQEMCAYFGKDILVPLYIEVEDGLRLERALKREREQRQPKYAELCRRFLADQEDFSEEMLEAAGIKERFSNQEMEQCVEEIKQYIHKKIGETLLNSNPIE